MQHHQKEVKNRNAELGIVILTDYRDRGYGTEAVQFSVDYAFRGVGMHRVSLTTFGGNERALRVYERV